MIAIFVSTQSYAQQSTDITRKSRRGDKFTRELKLPYVNINTRL